MKANGSRFSLPSAAALTVALAVTAVPGEASACGENAYLGQVCIMATSFCPRNTTEAAGQILQISSNQALFSLLGCAFGGDCRNTFALPDLRGRAPVGYGAGPGLSAHPFGQSFGREGVTQTTATLATHAHQATFTPGTGGSASAEIGIPVVSNPASTTAVPGSTVSLAKTNDGGGLGATPEIYSPDAADTTLKPFNAPVTGSTAGGSVTVTNTGGGQPIPTVPPEIAMRYCIVTEGLYPPRN